MIPPVFRKSRTRLGVLNSGIPAAVLAAVGSVGCVRSANEDKEAGHGPYPLAEVLQQATAEAAASQGRRLSRRDALKLGGVFGLAVAAAPSRSGPVGPSRRPPSRGGSPSWVVGWPG